MDDPSFSDYVYEPLHAADAVRILVLEPALELSPPLQCRIIQRSRSELLADPDNATQYTAVSYAWGEPDFSREITCDNSRLKVTPNVDRLLRHLRKRFEPRHLWIDAVCLNQGDVVEKSLQIPMMGDIYRQAKKVRIWLGEADEETTRVFACLRLISVIGADTPGLVGRVAEVVRRVFGTNSDEAILRFLDKPWFSRRWVIQEAALARQATVHCGGNSIPWLWLSAACVVLQRAAPEVNAPVQMVSRISRQEPEILLEHLWNFHNTECRDPQDRLLSLHGLVSSDDPIRSTVVGDGMNWIELYQNHALTYLRLGGFSDLIIAHLLAFGPLSNKVSGASSWIPDWTRPRQNLNLIEHRDHSRYMAMQGFRSELRPFLAAFFPSSRSGSPQVTLSAPLCWEVTEVITLEVAKPTWKDVLRLLALASRNNMLSVLTLPDLVTSMLWKGKGHQFSAELASVCSSLSNMAQKVDKILREALQIEGHSPSLEDNALEKDSITEILRNIKMMRDDDLSPEDLYILQGMTSLFLLHSFFIFERGGMGCGPKNIRIGDLVARVEQSLEPYDETDAAAVRLIRDLEIALAIEHPDDRSFLSNTPKARFLGPAFCVRSYKALTSCSGKFELI